MIDIIIAFICGLLVGGFIMTTVIAAIVIGRED